ncbi:MAG: flagellar motor protein MotB [Sulfitobacter sp.]|nr:flagellar motor protein MotB [Sulfitobacter sp.]
MGAQSNAAPVIIKRKKKVSGDGHHGGAWKVAYADFVTAMMAFFMLMWLLNATTEQQRKGIADYFTPTIPINRISGGGDGAFGGDSIFSEDVMARNGTGATSERPTEANAARGLNGRDAQPDQEQLQELAEMLAGQGGESSVMENALRHIVTRITDEGLVIELFELENIRLFQPGTDIPTQLLRDLTAIVAQTAKTVQNRVAVEAYLSATPVVIANNTVWPLSAQRADRVRALLTDTGIAAPRLSRVTGHADRSPAVIDPMSPRNNRVEIILLRRIPRN